METPDRKFENLAMISAQDEVFLSVPSTSFLSNLFHCLGHLRFGLLCPLSLFSYNLKKRLMVSLTVLELSGMLPSLGGAFTSCLIFTATDVTIEENVEVSDPHSSHRGCRGCQHMRR